MTYEVTATDICDLSPDISLSAASGSTFPLGTTVVTCTAVDDYGNTSTDDFTVTVVDTTPPVIEEITVDNGELWPPNHKMVTVSLEVVVSDLTDANPQCQIVGVSCNELPDDQNGDGTTEPDWEFVTELGVLSLQLRAERDANTEDRVYTIHVVSVDAYGNVSDPFDVNVIVPHDKGDDSSGNNGGNSKNKKK